ncbi:RCC1 domain-containing protein [Sorangium sp. So ce362]|uniref:RCC1 domain-containing protein n=1 Tax=Sorangium sp. So ce362 TaxID=3133303 RepID=UPI003F6092C5
MAALAASLLASACAGGGAETGDLEEPVLAASGELRVLGPSAIAAGSNHTCAIFEGGFVKCWGKNDSAQLGLGDTANRGMSTTNDSIPFVNLGTNSSGQPHTAKAIAAGGGHTCAILDDDTVKCWGTGSNSVLGIGVTIFDTIGDSPSEMGNSLPTVNLGTGRTAKAIYANSYRTCVILDNDRAKCWGANIYGSLGQDTTADTYVGDNAADMGDNLPPIELGAGRTVKSLALALEHFTCALLDNDTVKCWGNNSFGGLGLPGGTGPDRSTDLGDQAGEMSGIQPIDFGTGRTVQAIAAGENHVCAVLDNGQVKCWGANEIGELGYDDDNTIRRGDDPNEMGDNLPPVDLGTNLAAKAITANGSRTCVLLTNDGIKCWGLNWYGALGLGDTTARGNDPTGSMGDALPFVDIGTEIVGATPLVPTTIVAGGDHTCIIESTHSQIKCWGSDVYGQLGVGMMAPGPPPARGDEPGEMGSSLPFASTGSQTVHQVAVGYNHVCAHLNGGGVKCWGYNGAGQLGLGDADARGDVNGEMGVSLDESLIGVVESIIAGESFTCALQELPSSSLTGIKCWGSSFGGKLGNGATSNQGDSVAEMSSLDFINLGTNRTVKSASAGNSHVCAVLDDDTLKCWGSNSSGQLGLDDTTNRGVSSSDMGNLLSTVYLGASRTARAVATGANHTCVLLDNNTVKCWGENGSGQLGRDDTIDQGDQANEMQNLQAVYLGANRTAKAISAGAEHSCALLDDDTVKCWGHNGYGQLGLESSSNRGDAAGEMAVLPAVSLGSGRTAKAVSAGRNHTCALLDDNTIKCWGRNHRGQLGLGNSATSGDSAGEMGDSLPTVDLGFGRRAKAVVTSTNGHSTCALLDTSHIKCWGESVGGNLGGPGCTGGTQHCGDAAGEMGDALPIINLGRSYLY